MAQSLHSLKKQSETTKNKNTISDSDYFLRDKKVEAKEGYPNSHDMTPAPVVKPQRAKQGA